MKYKFRITPDVFKNESGLTQIMMKGKSIRHKKVKNSYNFFSISTWLDFQCNIIGKPTTANPISGHYNQRTNGPRCFMPSFAEISPVVLEKKNFEGFLPYMGMVAILVM